MPIIRRSQRQGAALPDTPWNAALCSALSAFDQHEVRVVLFPVEDDFAAIRRDIEIAGEKVRCEVRKLALPPTVEVDQPEVLPIHFAAQHHDRVHPGYENQPPRAATQNDVRLRASLPVGTDLAKG